MWCCRRGCCCNGCCYSWPLLFVIVGVVVVIAGIVIDVDNVLMLLCISVVVDVVIDCDC